jgi:hypothetical protein
MNTFDEFDEQTDFSFITLEESDPVAVTPKKSRSVQTDKINIGLIKDYSNRKRPSAEAKAKNSAWHKGKRKSAETRAKMSASRKGTTMPRDAVEKMRLTKLAKRKPMMTPLGPVLTKLEVSKIFCVDKTTIRNWMIKYPQHFYYITKD